MNSDTGFGLWIGTCIGILLAIIIGSATDDHPEMLLEKCQEDQVLIGIGDFEDGAYERYLCGPAIDDFHIGE